MDNKFEWKDGKKNKKSYQVPVIVLSVLNKIGIKATQHDELKTLFNKNGMKEINMRCDER